MDIPLHKPTRVAVFFRLADGFRYKLEPITGLTSYDPEELLLDISHVDDALIDRVEKAGDSGADLYVVADNCVFRGELPCLDTTVRSRRVILSIANLFKVSKADLRLYREQESGQPAIDFQDEVAMLELTPDAKLKDAYQVQFRLPDGSQAVVVTVRAENYGEADSLAWDQLHENRWEFEDEHDVRPELADLKTNVRRVR